MVVGVWSSACRRRRQSSEEEQELKQIADSFGILDTSKNLMARVSGPQQAFVIDPQHLLMMLMLVLV